MAPARLFSIGHSTHELADLIRLLRLHGIQQVVDVRRYPGSRRLPWFDRETLARELPREELAYRHLPELGGRRRPSRDGPNAGWRVEGFRGYADYMAGADFAAGLGALEQLAHERVTAIMCAEGSWWRCHRRLIAELLHARGHEVLHLVGPHEVRPHRPWDVAETWNGRLFLCGELVA